MTRPSTTLDAARAAIAREKLQARLEQMRARGEGTAAEREAPWCLECGNALTPLIAGYGCGKCRAVFVTLESGARWRVKP